jgi:hypothetical protein
METEDRLEAPAPEPVTITFLARTGTVRGIVSVAESPPKEFHGWLELMDELERVRSRSPSPPALR